MTSWLRLCPLVAIENGTARGFDPLGEGRDRFFVVRRHDRFYAYDNACPHPGYEGATMAWRKHAYLNGAGDRIVCSGHGANFEIGTGTCVSGPCIGTALAKADVGLADDGYLVWRQDNKWES